MSRALLIRPIQVVGDIAIVKLSQGLHATIDAADVDLVAGNNWSALRSPRRKAIYAVRVETTAGKQRMLLMHRILIGAGPEQVVDHKDGNGLNNVRSNLRLCGRQENALNTGRRANNKSGFKWVSFDTRSGRWRAEIGRGGKTYHLGLHDTPESAYSRYCAAADEIHGEFARLK